MILCDREIRRRCLPREFDTKVPMIEPFEPAPVREVNGVKVISYGLSAYGYDARLGHEYKIFHNAYGPIVDPKNFDHKAFIEYNGSFCIIPPNSFVLAITHEYFRIPRDIMTICVGKSTYARCGLIVNVTPFEPEWEGFATLEISNTTPLPAKIYSGEGICQILFFKADKVCDVSYADKGGKYQGAAGLEIAKV